MTLMSCVCPGCAGPIEDIDRFCQDCGLNLAAVALRPVLPKGGNRSTRLGLSPVQSAVQARLSPYSIWRLAVGAELLLVAAMVAYAGSAIFWVVKTTPDLMLFHKSARLPADHKIFKTGVAAVLPTARVRANRTGTGVIGKGNSTMAGAVVKPSTFVIDPEPRTAVAVAATPGASADVPESNNSTSDLAAASQSAGGSEDGEKATSLPSLPDEKAQPIAGQQLSDVAHYNKLLAVYFTRRNSGNKEARAAADFQPPSYQEWVEAGKQTF